MGGSPQSILRAARYGFNLMLANLGMSMSRLTASTELFRRGADQYGMPRPRVGLAMNGYIDDTDQGARDAVWPYHRAMFSRIGRERGWLPQSKENFEAAIDSGANLVGSPETAANQLTELILTLGLDRVDINYDVGPLPHDMKTRSLELFGREVYPRVREQLAGRGDRTVHEYKQLQP